jgi:hypothetical protein
MIRKRKKYNTTKEFDYEVFCVGANGINERKLTIRAKGEIKATEIAKRFSKTAGMQFSHLVVKS